MEIASFGIINLKRPVSKHLKNSHARISLSGEPIGKPDFCL